MFFRAFRDHDGGVTSIEYALLAGVMGTGVLMSMNYVADELTSYAQLDGCVWEMPEDNGKTTAEDGPTLCIGAPGWSPRRAVPPRTTRTASSG